MHKDSFKRYEKFMSFFLYSYPEKFSPPSPLNSQLVGDEIQCDQIG